jgi:hypothetical protein
MSSKVSLQKSSYGITSYSNVIDTNFRQLVPPNQQEEPEVTVEDFFRIYEELFFQIPIEGETNSHEYLVKTSMEYIGEPVVSDNEKALIEEINTLRRELLELTRESLNG